MDGLLNVFKPSEWTSFAVVRFLRHLSGERRVGHGGTLDPLASGVLPILLGKATRVAEYLGDTAKIYQADLVLGVETDTYDRQGRVQERRDASGVTARQVEEALGSLRGAIQQTPPMYSALHYQGQRLYTLARAGIEIERPARPITVHRLEIVAWRPPRLTLHITCSSGTYVRSLIHDLGRALGCGAILMELVRQQTGPFRIEGAHTLERLEEAFAAGGAIELLLPMDYPMATWPAVRLDSAGEAAARMGQAIPAASILAVTSGEAMEDLFWPPPASGLARAYDACGRFIGVVAWQVAGGTWRTRKLLA